MAEKMNISIIKVFHQVSTRLSNLEKESALYKGSFAKEFNTEDDAVLSRRLKYEYAIDLSGKIPGVLKMQSLQNVPYDPTSEYAKRSQSKKETYFAKFEVMYPFDTHISSKYVSLKGAYIDLLTRPEMIGNRVNTYASEYVAVFIAMSVIEMYQRVIETTGYRLEDSGLTIDSIQGLVSMNCNYSSESVPKLTIYKEKKTKSDKDGTQIISVVARY